MGHFVSPDTSFDMNVIGWRGLTLSLVGSGILVGWGFVRENRWQQRLKEQFDDLQTQRNTDTQMYTNLLQRSQKAHTELVQQIEQRDEISKGIISMSEAFQKQSKEIQEELIRQLDIARQQLESRTSVQSSREIPTQFLSMNEKGFPSEDLNNILFHEGYVSYFDTRTRNPCWSCEHLRTSQSGSSVDRKHSQFREDPAIPSEFQSKLSDYYRSGYDRGHLTPAGDVKFSQKAMDETFLLSNISPQVGAGFNRHYWARLEQFSRSLLSSYQDVYICSGPLYLPSIDPDTGKSYVKYEVIGNPPNVAVPTHFFKTILVENPIQSEESKIKPPKAIASFVLPNQSISPEIAIEEFLVPLDKLNRMSGLLFWNKVIDQQQLCSEEHQCKLPPPEWWKVEKEPLYPVEEEFQKYLSSSDSSEFHFPSTLSGSQRKQVHDLAEGKNLKHFSVGSGDQRHVVIQKSEL